MLKACKLMSMLGVLVLLSACAPSTASTVKENLTLKCPKGWTEIEIRDRDRITEDTAQIIEGNNDARRANGCPQPKRPPPAKKPDPAKTEVIAS
jgi:hypothetical protein